MNIRLCYKISAEVGLAEDENGNPTEAYVCTKVKNIKDYNIPSEQYKSSQKGMAIIVAKQLGCDVSLVTPISLNEYLDATEDEE